MLQNHHPVNQHAYAGQQNVDLTRIDRMSKKLQEVRAGVRGYDDMLTSAVANKNFSSASIMVGQGLNVNAIICAIEYHKKTIFECLNKYSEEKYGKTMFDFSDAHGITPLHIVAYLGDLDLVKDLLNRNVSISATKNNRLTPVMVASNPEIKLLIQTKMNANNNNIPVNNSNDDNNANNLNIQIVNFASADHDDEASNNYSNYSNDSDSMSVGNVEDDAHHNNALPENKSNISLPLSLVFQFQQSSEQLRVLLLRSPFAQQQMSHLFPQHNMRRSAETDGERFTPSGFLTFDS